MLFLTVTCGQNYPMERPTVHFVTKVNLPFVTDKGLVSGFFFYENSIRANIVYPVCPFVCVCMTVCELFLSWEM